MTVEFHVRVATDADLPALRDIEDAAGRAFTGIGMALVGADPPPSIQTFRQFRSDGRAWVWTDADDHPVGTSSPRWSTALRRWNRSRSTPTTPIGGSGGR